MSRAVYSVSFLVFVHFVKKGNCFSLVRLWSRSLTRWLVRLVLYGWVWWVV